MFRCCVSDDSLVVGSSLELLFNIRPRGPTSLLLFFGNLSRSQSGPEMAHYLAVYMHDGEVGLEDTWTYAETFPLPQTFTMRLFAGGGQSQ